jgi:hypothetical protein
VFTDAKRASLRKKREEEKKKKKKKKQKKNPPGPQDPMKALTIQMMRLDIRKRARAAMGSM